LVPRKLRPDTDWKNPPSNKIKELIQTSRTIAVVGLSPRPERPSHDVSRFLLSKGFQVIPVNPRESYILGQKCYPDLESIPIKVDIVDVFRKPEAALMLTESAIAIGVRSVWFQETVVSKDAFLRGESAGLMMVMDRCILKEYKRLIS
jgi:predicted CoA-binding protein